MTGAKFKSKTHLLHMFFLAPFFAHLALKFEKRINMTKKKFFNRKRYSKNAEFHADFESVEKVVKKSLKEVISKTTLTRMSKSENSAYFRHVFANNFCWCIFSKSA